MATLAGGAPASPASPPFPPSLPLDPEKPLPPSLPRRPGCASMPPKESVQPPLLRRDAMVEACSMEKRAFQLASALNDVPCRATVTDAPLPAAESGVPVTSTWLGGGEASPDHVSLVQSSMRFAWIVVSVIEASSVIVPFLCNYTEREGRRAGLCTCCCGRWSEGSPFPRGSVVEAPWCGGRRSN